jgi:hypothetical protein
MVVLLGYGGRSLGVAMWHGYFAQPYGACMDGNHLLDSLSKQACWTPIKAILLVATPCGCFSFGGISWFGLCVTMPFSRHPSQQTTLLVSTNKELLAGWVIHPKYTTHRLGRSPSTTKNRVSATHENG